MNVREADEADHAAILQVHREAFGREGEALLVERLVHEQVERISVVAQVDSSIVGHALFSEAQLVVDSSVISVGALGPIGVLRAHQRRGIGAALIRHGLGLCWQHDWPAVIVLGDPAYYGRFGFERADAWSIRCELDVPPEAFMIVFADQAIPGPAVAKYHPAFAEV